MKLLDVLTSPWAIQPEKLLEIQAIYTTHLRGEKIDIAAVEARLGRPLANEAKRYEVIDGVAVIPLEGVIAKRMNLFSQISGGVSSQLAGRDFREAMADPAVHSIILAVDSPGGTVDGTQALADLIKSGRDAKPVVTLASGTMASAAYWIGSAASRAYIADATTVVGSIGVVTSHVDVSGAEAQQGIKTTEIYAGKFKRIASQYGPLTDAGRQTIQEQVDYTYSLFVRAVADQRGVSEEKVLEDMADGRVFIGEQAVSAGLVDGVSTLEQLIADLNQKRSAGVRSTTSLGATMPLTREQIEAEAPEIVAALRAEGADAERARIQAVESALIPGHEALIASLKFDGKSSGGDAALAVNAAERNVRQAAAVALAAEAPKPVPQAAAPAVEPQEPQIDMSLPVETRAKAQWEKDASLHREFSSVEAYSAFLRAEESGRARILKKGA